MNENFEVEPSPLGRIVVWRGSTSMNALFYTTADFHGFLNAGSVELIRKVIRERFGIDAGLRTAHQVHGNRVREVAGGEPVWAEAEAADALWTRARNVALGIKVADCLPVTLLDADQEICGNAHSGWRGGVKQITAHLLDAFKPTSFDSAAAKAFLGPSIRACCFEVGEEVIDQFANAYGDVNRFTDRGRSRPHFDLVALTADLLRKRGLPAESIVDSGLCTRCDGSIFHSYRRNGANAGRNFAIVAQQ